MYGRDNPLQTLHSIDDWNELNRPARIIYLMCLYSCLLTPHKEAVENEPNLTYVTDYAFDWAWFKFLSMHVLLGYKKLTIHIPYVSFLIENFLHYNLEPIEQQRRPDD